METPYPNPISPTKTRIGWIGIGVMGAAMATRLLSAGYSLSLYARTPSKALDLQSKGALLVNSVLELAQVSDIVFTMVGHPLDVRQNVLDENGILQGLNPGGVVVDTTSSHPALARDIFTAARAKGCWAVDAPVSGGDIGARDGKLAIFGGGDEGVVNWLLPLFEVLGKVTYVGEAGCGQSCKIANQFPISANLLGLSEGLVFAERAGLDMKKFVEAVRGGGAWSMAMELFGERMIGRDFRPGGFAEYMVKDLGIESHNHNSEIYHFATEENRKRNRGFSNNSDLILDDGMEKLKSSKTVNTPGILRDEEVDPLPSLFKKMIRECSVLISSGNGPDLAKHCVPSVKAKRILITLRKKDDRKLPYRFLPDLELQRISRWTYLNGKRKRTIMN
ncbi:hypothetical protein Csa_009596 [Cucumis sativus]|nr:hypothetical protein Csa_009596 [Cucumis sativus]